jgi:type IV secretory pathway VirB3-like protein
LKYLQAAFWWSLTLLTLIILDDLLYGPIFWVLSVYSQPLATLCAFAASLSLQLWLLAEMAKKDRSRFASILINRLMLERKNREVQERETTIKESIGSLISAVFGTFVLGGVITTTLLLKKRTYSERDEKFISVLLCVLFSVEFCLIHGGWGIGGVLNGQVS